MKSSTESAESRPTLAMRLSRYFGTTPGFWMNLQMRYELDRAEDALGDTLSGIVPLTTVEGA